MFERIKNIFASKKRKQEFIRKLRDPEYGKKRIRFKDKSKINAGALIMLQDQSTGEMHTMIYTALNWKVYGNTLPAKAMTHEELEDFLTDRCRTANKNDEIIISDRQECLDFEYRANPLQTAGFHKVSWFDFAKIDEDK